MRTIARNDSLDALRGISILAMVLSGSIAFGGMLPGWMYHAQVPPPLHKFDPTVPGITWVDLVFPFFLFSMGAAIPLSLHKLREQPGAHPAVLWIAVRRYVLLTWFALFTYHMRAWVIAEQPGKSIYLLSILAFLLLFAQLYTPAATQNKRLWQGIKAAAYLIALGLCFYLPFHGGIGFIWEKSDIIILVLGNMAFFGTLIYWFTRHNALARLAVMPLVMAVFLGGGVAGSWTADLFHYSPLPWMYKFYYLKYLFIILPGTVVGEWLLQEAPPKKSTLQNTGILLVGLLIIAVNLVCLYERMLLLNLALSAVLAALLAWLVAVHKPGLYSKLWQAGTYLLLLGLVIEPWEGGIKKDPSTYSYYFVTAGLACYLLLACMAGQQLWGAKKIIGYLANNGKSPMVAYVAGTLLVTPLLVITGLKTPLDSLATGPWAGLWKGIIFTGIVSLITYVFTRQKWFWKS